MFFSTLAFALAAVAAVVGTPVPSASSSHIKRTTYTGQATYFYTGLGACGHWNYNSQPIIALDSALYEQYGGACGKWITIKNRSNGRTARGYIVDECPSCGWGSLDLSPSLFSQLGEQSQGVLPISWTVSGGKLKRSAQESDLPDDLDFPADQELTELDLITP